MKKKGKEKEKKEIQLKNLCDRLDTVLKDFEDGDTSERVISEMNMLRTMIDVKKKILNKQKDRYANGGCPVVSGVLVYGY